MSLYSKWDKGKNLTFVAGVIMLICIFITWITIKELGALGVSLGDFISRLQLMLNSASSFMDEADLAQAREMIRAYNASCWRWILLVPMVYPVYSLFTTRYNKNISCISCIVAFVVGLILIICGIKYMNFAAWLYLVASIVFFVGAVLSKPGMPVPAASASAPGRFVGTPMPPKQDTQPGVQPAAPLQEDTVFCPQCGTANRHDSTFCAKCGHPLG